MPLLDNEDHSYTPPISRKPSVGDLFIGFLGLGLIGFGGVLPLARRMIVEERNWLTGEEFTELLGLCQFLPGGNVINLSVAVGLEFRGVVGALASITGLLAAPTVIVIALGVVYDRLQNEPAIRHLFAGLAAAAAGLLVSTAIKMGVPMRSKVTALTIATATFIAVAVARLPLLPTMLVLAPLSILTANWWRR